MKTYPEKEMIKMASIFLLSASICMILGCESSHVLAKSQQSHSGSTVSSQASTGTTNPGATAINFPVEINQFSKGLDISNTVVYLNSSDGHYHLKGLAKNTLPETRSSSVFMTIDFQDKSTGTSVKSITGNINGPLDPGQTVPFDIDRGYTAARGNQLQFMKAQITYS